MPTMEKVKLKKEELEALLIVGAKVKYGVEYAKDFGATAGEIITLVEGTFEYDNGLYTENQSAPAIWNESDKDFESIYHLFGNDFEYFMDCEIVSNS